MSVGFSTQSISSSTPEFVSKAAPEVQTITTLSEPTSDGIPSVPMFKAPEMNFFPSGSQAPVSPSPVFTTTTKIPRTSNTNPSAGKFSLNNYSAYRIPKYLDGRYFNKVLAGYSGLVSQPLILTIKGSQEQYEIIDNHNSINVTVDPSRISLIRMILEIDHTALDLAVSIGAVKANSDEKPLPPDYANKMGLGTLVSRHSNLLVLDHLNNKLIRFEPLHSNPDLGTVSSGRVDIEYHLNKLLQSFFPGYELVVSPYHPQSSIGDTFCNAYVIQLAYSLAQNKEISISPTPTKESQKDIENFARAVEYLYGPLVGRPDVEFGPFDGAGGGLLGGALLGGALGGLTGGPTGLATGALLGGATGALIGGAVGNSDQNSYNRGYDRGYNQGYNDQGYNSHSRPQNRSRSRSRSGRQ